MEHGCLANALSDASAVESPVSVLAGIWTQDFSMDRTSRWSLERKKMRRTGIPEEKMTEWAELNTYFVQPFRALRVREVDLQNKLFIVFKNPNFGQDKTTACFKENS